MAARLNRMHSEQVRMKIQASVVIDRLHQHVMGDLDMTPSQVAAANSLLDRSVPKLSQIQHVGDPENPVAVTQIHLVAGDNSQG
jgi:hypothetical protein